MKNNCLISLLVKCPMCTGICDLLLNLLGRKEFLLLRSAPAGAVCIGKT